MARAARRDVSRRLPWARPLVRARLRSATGAASPAIGLRSRARLDVASAVSATRDRSRSRSNKTSCIVAYDMVLISCWTSSGRCAPPAAIVSDCAPVRMTGLIAATSPLPESAAFHNGVTGRPRLRSESLRAVTGRPRLRSESLRALGGIGFRAAFLDHGEFLQLPGSGRSSSRLRPATQNGADRVRFPRT
jgi:hypothetical protein